MRKFNEENERIKRHYLQYLREADQRDQATVDKAADAILRFEASTGFKPFKKFHTDQAIAFKRKLEKAKNARTGKPLSKATIDGILRVNRAFFFWLAGQSGYKSRITYSSSRYFNISAKDARIAHAQRDKRWSQKFGPVVKVDRLMRKTIHNDETKEPFCPLPGSGLPLQTMRGGFQSAKLRLKRSARK